MEKTSPWQDAEPLTYLQETAYSMEKNLTFFCCIQLTMWSHREQRRGSILEEVCKRKSSIRKLQPRPSEELAQDLS